MTRVSAAKCPTTGQNFTGTGGGSSGRGGFTAAVGDDDSGSGGGTQRDRLLHSAISEYARKAEIVFSKRGNKGDEMFSQGLK